MPDPQAVDDQAWAGYVFYRSGVPDIKSEWWCHIPSNTWFIAERNTLNDRILRTYLYEQFHEQSNVNLYNQAYGQAHSQEEAR